MSASLYDFLKREARNHVLSDLGKNNIDAKRADLTTMVVELQKSLYKVFCCLKNRAPIYEITYFVDGDRVEVYTYTIHLNNPFFKE